MASHGERTRGDLYRAALEATGLAVRHNIEAIEAAGGRIDRVVAVGGGTKSDVWSQIVSDITGRPQVIPRETIGVSCGPPGSRPAFGRTSPRPSGTRRREC